MATNLLRGRGWSSYRGFLTPSGHRVDIRLDIRGTSDRARRRDSPRFRDFRRGLRYRGRRQVTPSVPKRAFRERTLHVTNAPG